METVKEILGRPFHAGTRVTNCVLHMGKPLTERPDNCKLCLQDLRNQLSFAIRVNDFLNQKADDALAALKQSELESWMITDRNGPACDDCSGSLAPMAKKVDTIKLWNSRPKPNPKKKD